MSATLNQLRQAVAALQRGNLAEAIGLSRIILAIEPRNFDALHIVALASYHARDLETALRHVEQALAVRRDMPDAFNTHGLVLRAMARVPDAANAFSRALKLNPKSREAHYNLANCCQDMARLPQALEHYDQALRIEPGMVMAWNNRGLVLRKLGRSADAVASFEEAIRRSRDFAPAHYNKADALAAMQRFNEAIASYDQAIALRPDFAEAHCNRANVLMELGRHSEALAGHDRAIALQPRFHQAVLSRGIVLVALGRRDEAVESFRAAAALKPDYADAHYNLGKILRELGELDAAVASYDAALRLRPDNAETHNNRGNALRELNRLEEALASFDRAIAVKPGHVEAHNNRGNVLRDLGRPGEALASFDAALALSPEDANIPYNKALAALQSHRFAEGFALHQLRWNAEDFAGRRPQTTIPAWDGAPVAGKLLLWAEQGLGDEVFYASMLSLLDLEHMQVTVSADRRLHPAYRRAFPQIDLIDRAETDRTITGNYAAQAAIGDLGYLLGADASMIAGRRYPYLVANDARSKQIAGANPVFGKRPVCGLSWRSGNKKMGASRSIALSALAPVLSVPGLSFVSLQYGDVADEIGEVKGSLGAEVQIARDVDVFSDIDGLLSLIDMCDVVLTIDNVTAHLAGALGKTCIVLMPTGFGRYWYWGGEEQSFWYPSLRLVYQDRPGDWTSAIVTASRLVTETQ